MLNNARRYATLALISLLAVPGSASAETIFFDDFSDGGVTNNVPLNRDGNPITWQSWYGGQLSVENGDLVLRGGGDYGRVEANSPTLLTTDTGVKSLRTRFRLVQGVSIGVNARWIGGFSAYALLALDGSANFGGRWIGPSVWDVSSTGLDVKRQDIIMQYDYIGGTIAVRMWPVGDSVPIEPLLTYDMDPLFGDPPGVSLEIGSGTDEPREGVFRYVHVADAVIPEPTTLLHAIMAPTVAGALASRT